MKKLVSLGVSAAILAIIYWTIDLSGLAAAFARTDPVLLTGAILMVVPITGLTAWRLCRLVPDQAQLGLGRAVRMVLGASVLNMVLPAKMGDLAKFAFIRRGDDVSGALAFAVVIFEKTADMLALLVWCALGLFLFSGDPLLFKGLAVAVGSSVVAGSVLLASKKTARLFFGICGRCAPGKLRPRIGHLADSWDQMHDLFWNKKQFAFGILAFSVFLWFLHLIQIWLFILALGAPVPLLDSLALTPLAILAGLLPLTFAGVGTRDAALIFLYRPFMDPGTGAALGLLCTLRYILPALCGLPFFGGLWQEVRANRPNSPTDG